MVEVIITGGIVAAAAYVASRRPMSMAGAPGGEIGGDLPCPWCRSDTSEQDVKCPGCGQVFG